MRCSIWSRDWRYRLSSFLLPRPSFTPLALGARPALTRSRSCLAQTQRTHQALQGGHHSAPYIDPKLERFAVWTCGVPHNGYVFGPKFATLAVESTNLRSPPMRANQNERLHCSKEFEIRQNRSRANQIETMIAEFDRMCTDLGHQIAAEEMNARICDPLHFAYPTYAKAARERRAKLQRSADALRIELHKLKFEANQARYRQFAA